MTELPEPTGVVVGEERGYSDWFHVINWTYNYHMPKGTKFYTEEQMRDYGRAEYLRGIELLERMDWVEIMREGQLVTWGDAGTLGYRVVDACRKLAGEKT